MILTGENNDHRGETSQTISSQEANFSKYEFVTYCYLFQHDDRTKPVEDRGDRGFRGGRGRGFRGGYGRGGDRRVDKPDWDGNRGGDRRAEDRRDRDGNNREG